jgi:hypothetical protein
MTSLHTALITDGTTPYRDVATPPTVLQLVVALDAIAEHLQDANDLLGHRAGGMSMGAASRRIDETLPLLACALRRADDDQPDPVPAVMRQARARLRNASIELPVRSREALGIVPPAAQERAQLDLRLCRWTEAARLLATWLDTIERP